MSSDEDEEIDRLFAEAAKQHNEEVNVLLRAGQRRLMGLDTHIFHAEAADDASQMPKQLRPSESLRLYDVITMGRWVKVPDDARQMATAEATKDMAVYTTELLVAGMLSQERAKRRHHKPQEVLSDHEQEGCFEKLIDMEAFQVPDTDKQYVLCTTLARRLDVEHILTGNYVFLLVNGGSRVYAKDTVDTRVATENSVRKIVVDGYAILRETAVLENFFFEHIAWRTDIPLTERKYK